MSVRLRRPRDEQGMALATSMMIMLLCAIVVAAVLQLATHTAQRSGQSRDRNAALNAAQAGIQAQLSLMATGNCPTLGTETMLPDQKLPTESYIIQPPVSCTANGPAVIVATGFVPNATNPTATTTMVAHVNRTQGAPVSGGGAGGYDFPDALYTDGGLSAAGGNLNLYGTGGSVPSVTADTISIGGTGSQLGGPVTGQLQVGQSAGSGHGVISVGASQIGGPVTGTKVTVTGPAAAGVIVQGTVAATGDVSLTNATVNGAVKHGAGYTPSGTVTVTGGVSSVPPILPLGRPLGTFDNSNPGNIGSTLVVGSPVGTAVTSCPASSTNWTSSFYDISSACSPSIQYTPGTYASPAPNANTVIVVQGAFTVNVPQTPIGGQLYVIDVGGGGSDNLTINGSGSTLPVFAFTDGTVNLSGTLVGQVAAHGINVTGPTTLTFAPPATPMPDISFPVGYTAPNFSLIPNPYISTVSFQYQCPGTTAC